MRLAPAILLLLFATVPRATAANGPPAMEFKATAYAQSGITKSGEVTREGVVAADPTILPLGSMVRIEGAGEYDGVYKVSDTGSKVKGRHVDIYMPEYREAKQFGRRRVWVRVLRWGWGELRGAGQAVSSSFSKLRQGSRR